MSDSAQQLPDRQKLVAQADALFKEGVKLVLKDAYEAVEVLGKCLEIRNELYGKEALECAETYYQYGRALLEQARESTDALGSSKVRQDVRKGDGEGKGAGDGGGPSTSSVPPMSDGKPAAAVDENKAGDSTKGSSAQEGSQGQQEEDGEGEEEEEEEEEQEGEEDGDDLSLPFEMLEIARAIYLEDGADKHLSALADVHLRLGDLNAEKEEFGAATAEYEQCIAYINRMPEGAGTDKQRRLAEAHYDIMLPLQFDDRLTEALVHCRAAQKLMRAVQGELVAKLDTPVENETEEEADEEIERLEAELEDFKGILAELKDKEDELVKCCEQNASMKHMLKSVMEGLAKAERGGGGAGPSASPAKPATSAPPGGAGAAVNPMERGLAPLGDGKAPAGPVRHMGVVGRGRARITLQPQQPGVNAASAEAAAPTATGAAAAAPHAQQQQQQQQQQGNGAAAPAAARAVAAQLAGTSKRRLEDLMGGDGGVMSIGFGGGLGGNGVCVKQAPARQLLGAQVKSGGEGQGPSDAPVKRARPAEQQQGCGSAAGSAAAGAVAKENQGQQHATPAEQQAQ